MQAEVSVTSHSPVESVVNRLLQAIDLFLFSVLCQAIQSDWAIVSLEIHHWVPVGQSPLESVLMRSVGWQSKSSKTHLLTNTIVIDEDNQVNLLQVNIHSQC